MTWHDTENSEDATKILLELFNEFGKITGCKSNIQRSVAFLQTINYQKEKLRKQPALHGKKKTKHLGINPSKEEKNLQERNQRKHI